MPRKLRHHKQISPSHCGPAVLQILLENAGIEISQEEITRFAGAEKSIKKDGTTIFQLSEAVKKITDKHLLYYKYDSDISEIRTLLEEYDLPAGVEWQGIFDDEEDDGDEDFGHYSIISNVDSEKKLVIIVDPYKDYAHSERILGFEEFEERWWDTNEITDPVTGKPTLKKDSKLAFVVSSADNKNLSKIGFVSY